MHLFLYFLQAPPLISTESLAQFFKLVPRNYSPHLKRKWFDIKRRKNLYW